MQAEALLSCSLNKEIIKQVTSSWSLFTQLQDIICRGDENKLASFGSA